MDGLTVLASSLIKTQEVDYAFHSLLLYDHILCIREEVEYFWAGPWTLSRALYLIIRYTALIYVFFSIIAKKWMFTGYNVLLLKIKFFAFIIPLNTLCQSAITLRVWYLFSHSVAIRMFAVILLIANFSATVWFFVALWNSIQLTCLYPLIPSSPMVALIYVPSLITHTILFLLKVYRFYSSSAKIHADSFLWRFVKEGMFMYACASLSLLLGVVGMTMGGPSQDNLRIPAREGSPVVTLIVLSVCRAMLSIRSLAATSHVDPEWLLNHAELSRVCWRRGSVAGEIVVDVRESSHTDATILLQDLEHKSS